MAWPHRFLPLAVAGLAFGLYLATLAPGLTWEHEGADGGELIAASYTLGVAHPPGYPLYLLLGRAFSLLPWGDVAFRFNLMSAAFAAAAVGLGYSCLMAQARIAGISHPFLPWAGAVAALALAASPLLWSQATIAEVYALHAFLVVALLYALLRWRLGRAGGGWLGLAGLLAGLGLANHLSLALLLPPAALWVWRQRPPGRAVAVAGLAFFLGLSLYLYLPWRASQAPAINWGDPSTWSRFWWMVSGGPYRSLAFGLPLEHLPGRLVAFGRILGEQFQGWGLALALAGLAYQWSRDRAWAVMVGSYGVLVAAYALMYNTTDSYLYLLPLALVFSWWLGLGCLRLATWLGRGKVSLPPLGGASLGLGLFLLLPGVNAALNYGEMNLRGERAAQDYIAAVVQATEPDALILAGSDRHIFALWYYRLVEAPTSGRTVVAQPLLQYRWYQEDLSRQGLLPPGPYPSYEAALLALVVASPRPIYLTEPDPILLARYGAGPAGPLWQLRPGN